MTPTEIRKLYATAPLGHSIRTDAIKVLLAEIDRLERTLRETRATADLLEWQQNYDQAEAER